MGILDRVRAAKENFLEEQTRKRRTGALQAKLDLETAREERKVLEEDAKTRSALKAERSKIRELKRPPIVQSVMTKVQGMANEARTKSKLKAGKAGFADDRPYWMKDASKSDTPYFLKQAKKKGDDRLYWLR